MKVYIDYRTFWEKELENSADEYFRDILLSLDLEKKFWGYCVYDKNKEKSFIYRFNFYEQFSVNSEKNRDFIKTNILNNLHRQYFNFDSYNLYLILDLDSNGFEEFNGFKKFLFSEPVPYISEKIEMYKMLSNFYFSFRITKDRECLEKFIKELNEISNFRDIGKIEKTIALEYIYLAIITLFKENALIDSKEFSLFNYEETELEENFNELLKVINNQTQTKDKELFEKLFNEKIKKVREKLLDRYDKIFIKQYELIYKASVFRNIFSSLNNLASKIKKSGILDNAFFKEDKNSNRTKLNYITRGKRSASLDFISSFLDLVENKNEKIEFYNLFNDYNNLRAYLLQNEILLTFDENEKYNFYFQDTKVIDVDLSEIIFEDKVVTIGEEELLCTIYCYPYSDKIRYTGMVLVIKENNAFIVEKKEVADKYLQNEKYYIKSIVPIETVIEDS